MTGDTFVVVLDGTALTEALGRMARLGGTTPGPATWAFGAHGLKIAWMGMSAVLDCEVPGAAIALIDGEVMRGLARARHDDSLEIELRANEMKLGRSILDIERREQTPPQLLPLNTEPRDLLRVHVREQPERIEEAGLDGAVADVLQRLDASCATATKTLAWTGVTEAELKTWLLGRFDTPREAEVMVVEADGQVRLFDG